MPGPKIEYITNVTTYALLDVTGKWILQGGFPQFPDEIIIRQITFAAAFATSDVCLISSNVNAGPQVIGSLVNAINFTSCPQTTITVRSPLPNQLQFELRMPVAFDPTDSMIAITMDFIKYKRPLA
jgi:hypothetical protein